MLKMKFTFVVKLHLNMQINVIYTAKKQIICAFICLVSAAINFPGFKNSTGSNDFEFFVGGV